jgi:hypothetical protein
VGREVLELRVAPDLVPALVQALGTAVGGHRARGDVVHLFCEDAEAAYLRARATGIPLELQMARRATLEDVFLAVTGHALQEGAPPR